MTRPLAAALVVIIVKQHRPLRRQPTQTFLPHTLRTTATHRDPPRPTATTRMRPHALARLQ